MGYDYRQRQDALRYRMWKLLLVGELKPGDDRRQRFTEATSNATGATLDRALDVEIERAGWA